MIKRTIPSVCMIIAVVLCLFSCGKADEVETHKYVREIEGKVFSLEYVTFSGDGESRVDFNAEKVSEIDKSAEKAIADALAYLSDEHNEYISKINAEVDYVFDVDQAFLDVLDMAYRLSDFTCGEYKPAVGSSAEEYSAASVIEVNDGEIIKHNKTAKIDFGIVKESYALSYAVESLVETGVQFATVSYGDSAARIDKGERKQPADIAVYAVDGDDEYDGTLLLDKGFATVRTKDSSATDPVTGEEKKNLHNTVIVLTNDGKITSCLADAFMRLDTDRIKELYNDKTFKFEAVIIEDNGDVFMTHGAENNNIYETGSETAE